MGKGRRYNVIKGYYEPRWEVSSRAIMRSNGKEDRRPAESR